MWNDIILICTKALVTSLWIEITVGVIDDDIFEEDEYFYVHLSNPRVVGYPEIGTVPMDASAAPKAVLGSNHTATVTIYDDDHAGMEKVVLIFLYCPLNRNITVEVTSLCLTEKSPEIMSGLLGNDSRKCSDWTC